MSAPARIARLVSVETTKVAGGRLVWMGLVAVAAATVLTGALTEQVGPMTGWTIAARALGTGLWAAEIFVLVAGTTSVAGETDRGTLKMILPHAYRRSDWIFAKALVLLAIALALLLVAVGAALAVGAARAGLGDVTQTFEGGFGEPGRVEVLHASSAMASRFAESATVAAASLAATALLGLFVSCAFDAVIPALSTGFLLFMGLKSAGTLFGISPDALAAIYASYPGAMLDLLDKIGRGFGYSWDATRLGKGLELSGLVALASTAASLVVFGRRDLRS